MITVVHWQPDNKGIYQHLDVVRFGTLSQAQAWAERLPEGYTAHAIDTDAPNALRPLALTGHAEFYRALGGPNIAGFKHGREEADRRIMELLIKRVDKLEPMSASLIRQPKQVNDMKKVKLGKFEKIREASKLGAAMKAILSGGATLGSLGALLGTDSVKVSALLKRARVGHGVDHAIDDAGVVSVTLPKGVDADSLFKVPAPKKTPRPDGEVRHIDRIQQQFKAAESGQMPTKPIVTSETNKHRQKHFDVLCAHAEAGEWDKVAAYQMRGIDTYTKMIHRYRDQLLAAHNAPRAQAAE